MNNIIKTSDPRIQAGSRLGLLRKIVLALAIGASAHTIQLQAQYEYPQSHSPGPHSTGYLVSVETAWWDSSAGTDSLISMMLYIHGGHTKYYRLDYDGYGYDDQRVGSWDQYFFEDLSDEPSIASMEVSLRSNGQGTNPSWLWSKIAVERYKDGKAVRNSTRVWYNNSQTWLFGSYTWTYLGYGNPIFE